MADRPDITPELCRQLLRYDPEAGKLYWREREDSLFVDGTYPSQRRARSWNERCAGREAFTATGSHGYCEGTIYNVKVLAHRVIWAIQTGEWPAVDIDHINGGKLDNRWVNLRSVSTATNLRNAAGKSNNRSGVTGVSWRASRQKWRARIMIDGKETSLGHFDSFEDAVAARQAGLKLSDFTDRHGTLD